VNGDCSRIDKVRMMGGSGIIISVVGKKKRDKGIGGVERMKKSVKGILALLLVLCLGLSGCANGGTEQAAAETQEPAASNETAEPAASEPTYGGVLTIAGESEPGNLNTIIWPTTSDTNVTHMIYNCLLVPDKNLEMVGDLADSWTVSDDGKTYTIKLKEGITWHDGVPFTAEDVAFTFTAMADPSYDAGSTSRVMPVVGAEEFRNGTADSIEGIQVLDDLTISFTTKEPYAPFLASLYIGILPKHILEDVSPADWAKHESNRAPIGTGPFKFVKWEAGQYIELEANQDYFDGAPKLDGIIYRFGDANTMLAAFMNQEVDIAPIPIAEVEMIDTLDFAEIKLQNTLSVYYVGFNLRNEFFDEVEVRQALAHAVNKQLIVQSVLGQYGAVEDDIFPSAHWSHSPNLTKYEYDPNKAMTMLENAGFVKNANGYYERDGKELTFTLEVPTGKKEREQTAVLLKQDWEAIGVKCELQQLDFPTLVTKLLPKTKDGKQRAVEASDFDSFILGFGVEADPDEYRPYFHTDFMPPNGYNFCGYSTPEMDEMLTEQYTEVDPEARKQMFWKIGEELANAEPWIPIYSQSSAFVSNVKVKNFDPDFRGVTFNAEDWYIEQ